MKYTKEYFAEVSEKSPKVHDRASLITELQRAANNGQYTVWFPVSQEYNKLIRLSLIKIGYAEEDFTIGLNGAEVKLRPSRFNSLVSDIPTAATTVSAVRSIYVE